MMRVFLWCYNAFQNGPFYIAKWAVLACEMGRIAARNGPFRKVVSPPESLVVGHPLALGPQHLFYDVACASVASCHLAHVCAYVLYLAARVRRAARASYALHHLVVGYVVAYVYHFVIGESVFA